MRTACGVQLDGKRAKNLMLMLGLNEAEGQGGHGRSRLWKKAWMLV